MSRDYQVRGGATLPDETVLRVNATWPLGLLTLTDRGISLRISLTPTRWSADWTDLEAVDHARGSVVLHRKYGRPARFRASEHRLRPLMEALADHRIPINEVRGTFKASWRL